MMKLLGIYIAVFFAMFVLDMIWLRVIATAWYAQGMGHLMASSPNLVAAALFYLLFPLALVIFAVVPADGGTLLKAAGMGAMFGFFAYATYDLTNLATLKAWPLGVSALDMAWGSVVSGLSAAAGKLSLDWMK